MTITTLINLYLSKLTRIQLVLACAQSKFGVTFRLTNEKLEHHHFGSPIGSEGQSDLQPFSHWPHFTRESWGRANFGLCANLAAEERKTHG